MQILEANSLTNAQLADLTALMAELAPELTIPSERIRLAAESAYTHLFVMMDAGRIIGTASLCVYDSPTGRKASIEDVVVSSLYRGQGLGRQLMEHVIDYARKELGEVDLHLTSRPSRIAANELYQKLGFQERETNAYVLKLREG